MKHYTVLFEPQGIPVSVEAGTTLLQAQRAAGESAASAGLRWTAGRS